jgi:hypothetical protein
VIRYNHEQLRKCVAFLMVDVSNRATGIVERRPAATAFFVQVPIDETRGFPYVVTARHVLARSRPHGGLYLRVNQGGGGYEDLAIPPEAWAEHPATDVAVARYQPGASDDIVTIPFDAIVSDQNPRYTTRFIWPGDDVAFVGWFSEYPGGGRNEPLMRFGNVSLVPEHPVRVNLDPAFPESRTPVEAYLVEARSWGGQSGSPAFIDRPTGQGIGLLGLIHGHYPIKQEVKFLGDIADQGSASVDINSGIAIVIPAQKIIDTLMQEHLVEERDELLKLLRDNESGPIPDQGTTDNLDG